MNKSKISIPKFSIGDMVYHIAVPTISWQIEKIIGNEAWCVYRDLTAKRPFIRGQKFSFLTIHKA